MRQNMLATSSSVSSDAEAGRSGLRRLKLPSGGWRNPVQRGHPAGHPGPQWAAMLRRTFREQPQMPRGGAGRSVGPILRHRGGKPTGLPGGCMRGVAGIAVSLANSRT